MHEAGPAEPGVVFQGQGRSPSLEVPGPPALGGKLSYLTLAPHPPFLGLSFFICEMGIMMSVPCMVILVSQKRTKRIEVPRGKVSRYGRNTKVKSRGALNFSSP